MNGETINEYNPEIFEYRMWKLAAELQHIIRKEELSHLKIMICGDSLDGMLRNSQLMKLRWGMIESCMRLAEFLARWIDELALEVTISIYMVDGNHGEIRPLGSSKGEFENENLEKILAWYLAARHKNNSNVYIERGYGRRRHGSDRPPLYHQHLGEHHREP